MVKSTGNAEIDVALDRAMAAYNAMTPKQQKAMWAARKRSWVIGNVMLSNDMTRAEAEAIYDRVV